MAESKETPLSFVGWRGVGANQCTNVHHNRRSVLAHRPLHSLCCYTLGIARQVRRKGLSVSLPGLR